MTDDQLVGLLNLWRSITELMELTGLSRKVLRRRLLKLEAAGLLLSRRVVVRATFNYSRGLASKGYQVRQWKEAV